MNKFVIVNLSAALLMLLSSAGQVHANPPIYENFKGSVLNSGRWLGGRVDVGMVEMRRKIRLKDRSMHLRILGIANEEVTTGERQKVINRIWVDANRSPSLRSLQSFVQVNAAEIADCDLPNAASSRSAYQNLGIWFNNGSSTGSGDRLGDVFTTIGLRRSNSSILEVDELQVTAFVGACADSNCDTSNYFYAEQIDSYPMGSRIVLRTTWDETLKEFRFYSRLQGAEPVTSTFNYQAVASDSSVPGTVVRRTHAVQVRSDAADCDMSQSSSEQPFGLMDAHIYNVRISDTPDGL